ncbi:MAG: flagellar biosynthetic protein FliO [Lachnospiraceae bacterium]|nr:flagellar biosynthetic protein FliO [Lachnospiraceae bacterium]
MILTSSKTDGWAQLITVLLIFVAVLALTAFVTKYIANLQKQNAVNGNLEILETIRISNTKYIQLVRIGETYVAMAVCKDTVTKLCEIPKEQLKERTPMENNGFSFKELLESVMHKETKE